MLKFKEGETYICAESYYPWWTGGKEYSVINNTTNRPTIQDDSGTSWYDYEVNIMGYDFKLTKEEEMLNAKEGDTCIIKKADEPWWTEGKEYEVVLNGLGESCLVDDEGDKWEVNYLNNRMFYALELKEKETNQTHDIKEGQTYICKRDDLDNWTLDKEYKVKKFSNGRLYITDDNQDDWYLPSDNLLNQRFKLKEKTVDLNKLTTAELREYLELLENKEKSTELITLTKIDEVPLYVNINHIAAFYHNKAWECTTVILSDGTQLDVKDSVESIAKYF